MVIGLTLLIFTKIRRFTPPHRKVSFLIRIVQIPVLLQLVEAQVEIPIQLTRLLLADTLRSPYHIEEPDITILHRKLRLFRKIHLKFGLRYVLVTRIHHLIRQNKDIRDRQHTH